MWTGRARFHRLLFITLKSTYVYLIRKFSGYGYVIYAYTIIGSEGWSIILFLNEINLFTPFFRRNMNIVIVDFIFII